MSVNYSDLIPGTPIVWKNTAGDKVLNGKNLATVTGRQGDKSATLLDATKGFPEFLSWLVETKLQTAPVAGTEFSLYLGWSSSATAGTDNPAGLGGADAAGPNTDTFAMLSLAGSIILSNNIGMAVQRQDKMIVVPKDYYVIPVIYNGSAYSTTNTDGETSVTMTPWYRRAPVA